MIEAPDGFGRLGRQRALSSGLSRYVGIDPLAHAGSFDHESEDYCHVPGNV